MKVKLIKEVSPESVIVEIKTDRCEGRKLVSRKDYMEGKVALDESSLYDVPIRNRNNGKQPLTRRR